MKKNINDMVEYGRTGNVELYKQYDRNEGCWKLVDSEGNEYEKKDNSTIKEVHTDYLGAVLLAAGAIAIGLIGFITCIVLL